MVRHGLEKVNLEIGFLPITACAPLAIAKEKGFFIKHGLDEVNLVRESSWRGIVDGITGGYLDAAQMPSGMPMWLSLGGNKNQPLPVVTALTMTRNGNAITLAKRFYVKMNEKNNILDNIFLNKETAETCGQLSRRKIH